MATFLGIPVGTLYDWRCRGEGPPAFKVGRRLRYRETDVFAWLEEQTAA
ncbi:helix-turn-helix domain-containing protein [Janibacter cremeus]|uniref:Helix-turn-helix domain-containing protein n=1 Tax=Janibacter alittae TaxID=3115209 RepID=A0ABZ2MI42_9MICO|nr:helix-turn-helix domain-containing protein [Janibacter cremeus]WEV77730.1 helix-turn-helix domain-containing protein [Janibacter cremeus]